MTGNTSLNTALSHLQHLDPDKETRKKQLEGIAKELGIENAQGQKTNDLMEAISEKIFQQTEAVLNAKSTPLDKKDFDLITNCVNALEEMKGKITQKSSVVGRTKKSADRVEGLINEYEGKLQARLPQGVALTLQAQKTITAFDDIKKLGEKPHDDLKKIASKLGIDAKGLDRNGLILAIADKITQNTLDTVMKHYTLNDSDKNMLEECKNALVSLKNNIKGEDKDTKAALNALQIRLDHKLEEAEQGKTIKRFYLYALNTKDYEAPAALDTGADIHEVVQQNQNNIVAFAADESVRKSDPEQKALTQISKELAQAEQFAGDVSKLNNALLHKQHGEIKQNLIARTKQNIHDLKPGESVLIPGGFAAEPSGHAMMYLVERQPGSDKYMITVINTGTGAGPPDPEHGWLGIRTENGNLCHLEEVTEGKTFLGGKKEEKTGRVYDFKLANISLDQIANDNLLDGLISVKIGEHTINDVYNQLETLNKRGVVQVTPENAAKYGGLQARKLQSQENCTQKSVSAFLSLRSIQLTGNKLLHQKVKTKVTGALITNLTEMVKKTDWQQQAAEMQKVKAKDATVAQTAARHGHNAPTRKREVKLMNVITEKDVDAMVTAGGKVQERRVDRETETREKMIGSASATSALQKNLVPSGSAAAPAAKVAPSPAATKAVAYVAPTPSPTTAAVIRPSPPPSPPTERTSLNKAPEEAPKSFGQKLWEGFTNFFSFRWLRGLFGG